MKKVFNLKQMQASQSFKDIFQKFGNLNLLQNYRGQKRIGNSLVAEIIKYLIVVGFWVTASFSAGIGVAGVMVYFMPLVLKPLGIASGIIDFIVALGPLAAVLTFIPVNAMFLVLLERKLLALLTTRLGPNRVGFNGLLQTFADALKLLFKVDIVPVKADKLLFLLAPVLFFAPSVMAFLPLVSVASAGTGPFAQTVFPTSLIFVVAVSSLTVMGLVMAGWASNNKYAILGGLRSAAQAISYEIPLVLSLTAFVIIIGSLDLQEIASMQSKNFFDWNIWAGGAFTNSENFKSAFGLPAVIVQQFLFFIIAFLVYFCSLAEVNRIPFDLPEAESELVSGYNTEYSGMKFALFFLAEYTNLFITSTLLAILFFGGPYSGIPILENTFTALLSKTVFGNLVWLPGAFILLLKAYLLVSVAIWIRATLPRFRSDQLMGLAWKVLIPLALACILFAALCRVFVQV